MLKVLHPITNELIDYKQFKEYSLQSGYQKINDAPSPKCPVCHNDMNARAGQTKNDGHFAHEHNVNCPTKQPAARPYLGLNPTPPNHQIILENKQFLENNIEAIYTKISELAPYLDFLEFIEMIKEARRLNIYNYANLQPQYLPYVLVTLINFLPTKSFKKCRNLKFMFFFENHIQNFVDLWIHNGINSKFYRISYKGSATNKLTEIELTDIYLAEPVKNLSERQIAWCLREI